MKKALYQTIIVITLAILTSNCEDRSWDNPFGGDLNPEDWATNFTDSIQQAKINEAVLTWKAVNKNIDGYIIRRNINDKGEIVEPFIIKRAGNTDTSYIDEQLIPDPNLHYNYQISAYAGAHESLVNDTSITPSFPAPSNFKYSILDKDLASINISWNDNSNGEDGFSIYRKYSGYDWVKILQTNEDVTAFVDHVPQSTNIQYKIEGFKSKCTSTSLYGELNIAGSKSLIFGGNKNDELNAICRTPNLTYVAVGSTTSTDFASTSNDIDFLNSQRALVVEFDHNLNIRHMKSFGGSGSDFFKKIVVVNDGYVVLGHSNSNNYDCIENNSLLENWILKLDFDFNIIWSKFYDNELTDINELSTERILLCGEKENDGWILVLDKADGSFIKEIIRGGNGNDRFNKILYLENDTVLIAGQSSSTDINFSHTTHNGNNDIWLVKMTHDGTIMWSDVYGTPEDNEIKDIVIVKSFNTDQLTTKYERYIVLLVDSDGLDIHIPLYLINLEGVYKKTDNELMIPSDFKGFELKPVSLTCHDDVLIFSGALNNKYAFALKAIFYTEDMKSIANWNFQQINGISGYDFSVINDQLFSFNGNSLCVGSVRKYAEGADSGEYCWIIEIDNNAGIQAE